MSFFSKSFSFSSYKIEGEAPSVEAVVAALDDTPIRDITKTDAIESVSFCSMFDMDETNWLVHRDSLVGFCLRHDKKRLSKSKVDKEYKRLLAAEMKMAAVKSARKIPAEIKNELKEQAERKLAVGVLPHDRLYSVIIDLKDGMIYTEVMSDDLANTLFSKLGVDVSIHHPFGEKVAGLEDVMAQQEIFLSWLYLSTVSSKNDSRDVSLDGSIKMSDDENSVSVNGDVKKFFETYRLLSDARQVSECSVRYDTGDFDLTFKLKAGKLDVYNFSASSLSIGSDRISPVLVRLSEIKGLLKHLASITKLFYSDLEKLGEEGIRELRDIK